MAMCFAATEESPDKYWLVAMDHTHCFDNGSLNAKVNQISAVKDEKVYGLFPEFRALVSPITLAAVLGRLKNVTKTDVEPMVHQVPSEWQVEPAVKENWAELIVSRAQLLIETMPTAVQAILDEPKT